MNEPMDEYRNILELPNMLVFLPSVEKTLEIASILKQNEAKLFNCKDNSFRVQIEILHEDIPISE